MAYNELLRHAGWMLRPSGPMLLRSIRMLSIFLDLSPQALAFLNAYYRARNEASLRRSKTGSIGRNASRIGGTSLPDLSFWSRLLIALSCSERLQVPTTVTRFSGPMFLT